MPKTEKWCQRVLADQKLHGLLEKVDEDFARQAQQGRCQWCGGPLHRSDYDRQPCGGPAHWNRRDSFCCGRQGCRKRHTPMSVRFLGRKVYVGIVVVLVSAMAHGLKPERVRVLRERLGIDRRTLQHWRKWWLETFVPSSFWQAARARFSPPVCPQTLPWSLLQAFGAGPRDRLLKLMKFLCPLSVCTPPIQSM